MIMGILAKLLGKSDPEPEVEEKPTEELTLAKVWINLSHQNPRRHWSIGSAENAHCRICGRLNRWGYEDIANPCDQCKTDFEAWFPCAEAQELFSTMESPSEFDDLKKDSVFGYWAIRQALAYDVMDKIIDKAEAQRQFAPIRAIFIESHPLYVREKQKERREKEHATYMNAHEHELASNLADRLF